MWSANQHIADEINPFFIADIISWCDKMAHQNPICQPRHKEQLNKALKNDTLDKKPLIGLSMLP